MNFERQKEMTKQSEHRDKMSIEQQKLNTQREISQNQLEIAVKNKNRFDKPDNKKDKKK
jgi:hypothetical protein